MALFKVYFMSIIQSILLVVTLGLLPFCSTANENETLSETDTISTQLEAIKSQVLTLNRDLFILEEDLLFPASTQISVFVSVDIGRFFTIDSVELKVNDKNVAGFLYTEQQRKALEKGGIQRLYLGNLKVGQHQLTAIFTGMDSDGRNVQRAVNHSFEKDDESLMIELKVEDSESNYRANVHVEEWIL
jgi:hypothetical protein